MKKFSGHWISLYKSKKKNLEYLISDFDILFITRAGFVLRCSLISKMGHFVALFQKLLTRQ
jgi:hypothetical protein